MMNYSFCYFTCVHQDEDTGVWAKRVTKGGHSTTTWTEFCHFFTPLPLCGQFLYPECGQKQTFFDPPHLVHVVIECPLRTFTPCKLGKNELNNTCYLGLDYLQRFFFLHSPWYVHMYVLDSFWIFGFRYFIHLSNKF